MWERPKHVQCYFAHPMVSYRSPEAKATKAWLLAFYGESQLRDPEDENWGVWVNRLGDHEAVYRAMIEACDVVVVMDYHGYIGRGTYREVQLAFQMGKPVFTWNRSGFCSVIDVRLVDPNDWAYQFARLVVE